MGSSASKYVIGLGFVIIFFGMFFQTWMHASPDQQRAHLAVLDAEIKAKTQAPPMPQFAKSEMPKEDAWRNMLRVKAGEEQKEDYKNNLKEWHKEAETRVNNAVSESYNKEVVEKTEQGNAKWQEEYTRDYADYLIRKMDYDRNCYNYQKRLANAGLRVAEEDAENGWGRWFWGMIIYFGVFIAGIGFIALSIQGEGNEKLGALVALGLLPIFIVLFLYGTGGV